MKSFFLCMCYRLVDMSTNPCMEMKVGLLKGTVDEAVVVVDVGGGGGGGGDFMAS